MSTPTRKQIHDAHKALEELYDWALEWAGTRAHIRYGAIRDVLPPKPKPTMADVEWDDDVHYLAEAEQNVYGNVIMLGVDDDNMNMIAFLVPPEFGTGIDAAFRETLTPTGKRYTLTEVQE